MLNDEYILRDYVDLRWKDTVETDDYICQKFLLVWEQRVVIFDITYYKKRNIVGCSWSCEGYIFYILADHLSQFARKLERATEDEE